MEEYHEQRWRVTAYSNLRDSLLKSARFHHEQVTQDMVPIIHVFCGDCGLSEGDHPRPDKLLPFELTCGEEM